MSRIKEEMACFGLAIAWGFDATFGGMLKGHSGFTEQGPL